jgi:uncharacterized protein (TIRG00374 family)
MSSSPQRTTRSDHRVKVWVTYIIAMAALVWVFHDLDWPTLLAQVQRLSWGWVLAIVALDVLSFYVQGVRWQILLQPIGKLPYIKTTQAIYVGLFTSEVLPLRAGEIIRGILAARWLKRKFRDVLPSMAMERIFDAFWFSGAMIITALLIDVPPQIRVATNVMLGIAIVGIVGFVWVVRKTHFAETWPEGDAPPKSFIDRLRFAFYEARLELKQIGLGRRFWAAAAVSGLLHVVQGLAFLAVLEACGIQLPLLASIAVFLVVHLGIAIPNAPANVGTFQLFCVLGLTFFGVEKSAAAAFSLVAWTILTIPVLLIGVAATLQAGLSLTGFHDQLRNVNISDPAVERAG